MPPSRNQKANPRLNQRHPRSWHPSSHMQDEIAMARTLIEPHKGDMRRRKPAKTKEKPAKASEATMTRTDEEKSNAATDQPWLKEYMLSLCR